MKFQSEHATDVFLRLHAQKQHNVFNAAAAEFAAHGYDGANTNKIAGRAGISVGSLFQYFGTKQSLFHALVDYGTQMLLAPVIDDVRSAKSAPALFRRMLLHAQDFAKNYPDYNRIYLSLTAYAPGATALARRIEGRTIASYRRAMRANSEGDDARNGCIAFLMDELVLSYQFSFASEYYRARLMGYTGMDPVADGPRLIDALCALVEELVMQ